jgi:hypothetical protein
MFRYVVDELSKIAENYNNINKTINNPNSNNNSTKDLNKNIDEFKKIKSFKQQQSTSKIDEYDWFNRYQSKISEKEKYKKISKEVDDCLSLTSSFESYYEDLNKEFRFDNLNKFYSPNSKFKQCCFKMLTSYEKDEFLYAYLDNDAEIDLVETLKRTNTLKAVEVFQKSYYQEQIKGELIRVPSWRMKEKVLALEKIE